MEARESKQRLAERDMHVCPECERPFVQPDDWSEAGPHRWSVELTCPNCDWSGSGIFSDDAVERFDRELDRGTSEILADLERLTRSSMAEYAELFVTALRADQVLPEDF
jgi:hypothetical protein